FAENCELQKSGEIRVSEIEKLFEANDLTDLDAIVLDEKIKQKHLPFNDLREVTFQPHNPARYVGLIALKNFENGVSIELIPQYVQAIEIGKSIKTS
ncbi:MAG TPA: hypothetical protein VGB00_18720, partial [Pyrinomonadaceae bacterium]